MFRPFQCVDRGQRFLFGKFSRSHYVASIVEAMKKLFIILYNFFINSIDKKTWYVYNKNMQRKLGMEVFL